MTTAARQRPSVVVGVDGSPDGRHALHWAAAHAGRRRQSLRVLHAVDLPRRRLGRRAAVEPSDATMVRARELVDSSVAHVERIWPDVPVTGRWEIGTASELLTDAAAASDLLVVGSRGRGRIRTALLGSVSAEVAQRAGCPVVVVRTVREVRSLDSHRGVVVGVDGSVGSAAATGFAFAAAAERGLGLTVAHAVWDPNAESPAIAALRRHSDRAGGDDRGQHDLVEPIAGWKERYPDVPVVTRYEYGRPGQVLADVSAGADLLVVGDRGRDFATEGPLGSVSRDVLRRARCPVAVVRGRPL
jgi:nucleotide-binding universal stress UspA family protein